MFPNTYPSLFATRDSNSDVVRDALHTVGGQHMAVLVHTIEKGIIVNFMEFPPVGGVLERNESMELFYSALEKYKKVNFYKESNGWSIRKNSKGAAFEVRLLEPSDIPEEEEQEEEQESQEPEPNVPETKKPKSRFIQRIARMFGFSAEKY